MLCSYPGSKFGNFIGIVDIGLGKIQSLHGDGVFFVITLDGVED